MSKPEPWTAYELAQALMRYGDMPVAVSIVTGTHDEESDHMHDVRLEMNMVRGRRFISITGYDQSTGADIEDDEEEST